MLAEPHPSDDELLSRLSCGEQHPHLAVCPACGERYRTLGEVMGTWPVPRARPGPEVWDAIAGKIRLRRRRRPLTAVAAVLATLLLATAAPLSRTNTGPGVQRLVGTSLAPQAAARIVPTAGGAIFVSWGLPPTRSNQVYELWAIHGTSHIRAAVFRSDSSGRARVTIPASLLSSSYGVTLERSPGASHPSGRRILRE